MITKHFLVKCAVLGVILSALSAGTASAQGGGFTEVKRYCDGVESGSCEVGQEVTMVSEESADWDPDAENSSDFHPEQNSTTTFRYRYDRPGLKVVVAKAVDSSGRTREITMQITDPDGKPDPTLQPSLASGGSGFYARKEGSVCVVDWTAFFTGYRDFAYNARLYAGYRQRVQTARGSRIRKGALQLVRQQRLRRAAYAPYKHALVWRFDRRSPRIRRLIRKRTVVRVSMRERVMMDGQTVYRLAKLRRFNLGRCSF